MCIKNRNNPLMYTDPSGYFSFKKWVKSTLKAAFVPTPKNVFNAIHEQPFQAQIDKFILKTPIAYAIGQGVATYFTAFCGGCGGALWSAYYTYEATGSMNAAFRSGAISYATTYAGNYVGANFTGVEKVLANATVSGVSAELQGGSFADGFKLGIAMGALRMGYDYTQERTDALKLAACSNGGTPCVTNKGGALLTDGARDVDYTLNPNQEGNWLTRAGMGVEGSGGHFYSENSAIGRFVNAVSKLHDFMNSWNYNSDTGSSYFPGYYISRGAVFDTLFQGYSFAGMLPAAGVTALSLMGDQPAITSRLSLGR